MKLISSLESQERPSLDIIDISSSSPIGLEKLSSGMIPLNESSDKPCCNLFLDDRDGFLHYTTEPASRPSDPYLPIPKTASNRHQSPEASGDFSERATRTCLLDWSEQHWANKGTQNSGSRPKTFHGKQLADTRGGRASARRDTSSLHLRSQSVPISRDSAVSSGSHYSSPKFGTWGLGSKGVSEDWDGDFEFDDSDRQEESKRDGINSDLRSSNDFDCKPLHYK
jgi:hypothetical protein